MTGPEQQRSRAGLVVLVAAGCLLLGSTGGAVAGAAITGKQIKDSSVTGKDIKDQSLEAADLAASAQHAGPQGPAGPAGTPGVKGDKGATGIVDFQTVDGNGITINTGTNIPDLTADCLPGYQVLGGGMGSSTTSVGMVMVQSRPYTVTGTVRGWKVSVTNNSGSTQTVFAFATCAKFAS